jgi:hypothetical protein
LTVRRACGQSSESTQFVWRPVYSDNPLRDDKGGFGAQGAKVDRQEGQAGFRHARTQDASLRAQATSDGARVRLADLICGQFLDMGAFYRPVTVSKRRYTRF